MDNEEKKVPEENISNDGQNPVSEINDNSDDVFDETKISLDEDEPLDKFFDEEDFSPPELDDEKLLLENETDVASASEVKSDEAIVKVNAEMKSEVTKEAKEIVVKDASSDNESDIDGSYNNTFTNARVGGDLIIHKQDSTSNTETYGCANCGNPLDIDVNYYGKIECGNCGKILFRKNHKLELNEFKDIFDKEETKEYKKIIAHINNKIIDKKYDVAYKFCKKAEVIAPGEPITWWYTALCAFLKDVNKTIDAQARNIFPHLDKCKLHGIAETKYEELLIEISNKLFFATKRSASRIRPYRKDKDGYPLWKAKQLKACLKYLNAYKTCYTLFQDSRFLEEAVNELSKPYKWIVKDMAGNLKNMPNCGSFRAVRRREELIRMIKVSRPEYIEPDVEIERINLLPDIRIISFE